ncbi:GntR family transcriptional regulator [Amycolatopsis australiensis]|uniref:DNA-binding transcriptional regulator, GntR family n=1 Tax=Amycolatopsis australiensis TaxID=546364 RepID=A0A1K1SEH1_9PSEU|nr:GntR family transcriptional regulator [Amycolatopsis australiensis]SFW82779.1 DNA-binding transcriptional regulator, GntR family [Amycolatopsis australiensis]
MVLQTTNTRDALVAEVRHRILSGELEPGRPLTEQGLATTFGVARPTVRSALQELVARHLVERAGGRSLRVPVLTDDDVRDLFTVRLPLELTAARLIISQGRPLAGASAALAALEALPPEAGWSERVAAHTEFHLALVAAAGSTRLNRIYPPLQEEMQLCLARLRGSYPDPAELAVEHRRLLTAIASGNPASAEAELRDHLARARDGLLTT